MGRISHSWCTSHVVATASGRILAAYRISALFPTDRSGVLAVADAVGSSTWRASIAALWIASMEDTASTYNFHASHGKTCLCQNKFHMFT
jgi:hypothetical protein